MGITAIANDYLSQSFISGVGKETASAVGKTESFLKKEMQRKNNISENSRDSLI